jgi:two-component system chemotaxis response regulator CheY
MQRPTTALIVDDEPHIRIFLKLVLRDAGFSEFIEASNGQEGVDFYKEHNPDIVLMDVNMPVKEGLIALTEMIAHDSKAVVVMMTSVASRHAVETSVEMGATHYIRKDTPKETMVEMIKDLVEEIWGQGEGGSQEG